MVLHGSYGASFDPVDTKAFVILALLESDDILSSEFVMDVSKNAVVFDLSPVRELVMASFPASTAGVVVVDPVVSESELSKASLELKDISDVPVVLSHVAEVIKADDAGHYAG